MWARRLKDPTLTSPWRVDGNTGWELTSPGRSINLGEPTHRLASKSGLGEGLGWERKRGEVVGRSERTPEAGITAGSIHWVLRESCFVSLQTESELRLMDLANAHASRWVGAAKLALLC